MYELYQEGCNVYRYEYCGNFLLKLIFDRLFFYTLDMII